MGVIKINNIIYGSNNSADIIYKNTTVEEKLNSIPIFDPSDNANIEGAKYDYLTYGHIINHLESDAADKILSAKQGKVLNDKLNNIDFSPLENAISEVGNEVNNNKEDIFLINDTLNIMSTSIKTLEDNMTNNAVIDNIQASINTFNNSLSSSEPVYEVISTEEKKVYNSTSYTILVPSDAARVNIKKTSVSNYVTATIIVGSITIGVPIGEINDIWTVNCSGINEITVNVVDQYNDNNAMWLIFEFEKLNSKGVMFKFGIDANGNYGYYKDGADTVTPFKSNNLITGYSSSNVATIDFGPNKTVNGFVMMTTLSGKYLTTTSFIRNYTASYAIYGAAGANGGSHNISNVLTYNATTGVAQLKDLNGASGIYYAIW